MHYSNYNLFFILFFLLLKVLFKFFYELLLLSFTPNNLPRLKLELEHQGEYFLKPFLDDVSFSENYQIFVVVLKKGKRCTILFKNIFPLMPNRPEMCQKVIKKPNFIFLFRDELF